MLLSSSGFVMQKHYCQNELKKYALFVKPSECESHTAKKPLCPLHAEHSSDTSTPSSDTKGCCENEIEFLKIELPYQVSTFDLSSLQPDLQWSAASLPTNEFLKIEGKDFLPFSHLQTAASHLRPIHTSADPSSS